LMAGYEPFVKGQQLWEDYANIHHHSKRSDGGDFSFPGGSVDRSQKSSRAISRSHVDINPNDFVSMSNTNQSGYALGGDNRDKAAQSAKGLDYLQGEDIALESPLLDLIQNSRGTNKTSAGRNRF